MIEYNELLRLTKENNELLKQILVILSKDDSAKSLAINLFANLLSGRNENYI